MLLNLHPQTATFRFGQISQNSPEGSLRQKKLPKAAVVIHGATGVPHQYYGRFAQWLAEQGFAVLTYDYRGFGASYGARSSATMAIWGLSDQPAAQAFMEREFPGVPVWIVGHSLGGLMLPFQKSARRVARLITVASGPVHFSDHPLHMKLGATMLWHTLGPAMTAALGKMPGWLIGGKTDLPAGVYWEWRRWCTTRGFYLDDVGRRLPAPDFSAFAGDARIVAVADDAMVPPEAVWRLMQLYPEAMKQQHVVRATDHGLGRIGHVAVFHPRNAVVWPGMMGFEHE